MRNYHSCLRCGLKAYIVVILMGDIVAIMMGLGSMIAHIMMMCTFPVELVSKYSDLVLFRHCQFDTP